MMVYYCPQPRSFAVHVDLDACNASDGQAPILLPFCAESALPTPVNHTAR
jgi:hypothetical protein